MVYNLTIIPSFIISIYIVKIDDVNYQWYTLRVFTKQNYVACPSQRASTIWDAFPRHATANSGRFDSPLQSFGDSIHDPILGSVCMYGMLMDPHLPYMDTINIH